MTPIAPALLLSRGRATAGRATLLTFAAALTATAAAPRAPIARGAARRAR
jgi:hypothetical protein